MSKLKIKFSLFERAVVMQVQQQSKEITEFLTKGDGFHHSNGIIIGSANRPGIYPKLNTINVRGILPSQDSDIVYGKFETDNEAKYFMSRCIEAVEALGKITTSYQYDINLGFGEHKLNHVNWELAKMSKCVIFGVIGDYPTHGVDEVLTGDLPLSYDKESGVITLPTRPENDHQCMIKVADDKEADDICIKICRSLVKYNEALSNTIKSTRSVREGEDIIVEV